MSRRDIVRRGADGRDGEGELCVHEMDSRDAKRRILAISE
jgi:hypothetical protein